MLDEQTVRDRRDQVRKSLAMLDQERSTLQAMLSADEAWLQLHGYQVEQMQILPLTSEPRSTKDILLDVLRSHYPQPVHVGALWDQAAKLGARSTASDPVHVVDTVLRELVKTHANVRSMGNRTYVWKDPNATLNDLTVGEIATALNKAGKANTDIVERVSAMMSSPAGDPFR